MTQSPQEKLAALAQRAIPFLRDEGAKYDDDGSNEPLELARDIEQALSEHGEVTVTTDESGRCVAVTRQDSEGRILSTIWEAPEHGGGGEPEVVYRTPSAPVVDDAMVERACEVLSEHALDGDGPSTHAMRLALTAALSGVSAPVGVEDHVRRQVGRLAQWSKCMSHNESYFGEPAGLVKSVTDELSHAVDPIYPPIVPPADPLAGVTIHTATLPLATPAAAPRGECNCHLYGKAEHCPLHTQADYDSDTATSEDGLPQEAVEDKADWAFIERCQKECGADLDDGDNGIFWTFDLTAMKKLRRLAASDDAYISEQGSVTVDWDDDPQRQLSIMVKRDGSVTFAAYANGQRFSGDAKSPEFWRALSALAASGQGVEGTMGAILAEVERATRKFPTWPTDPLHAVAVLGEEYGELNKAVLQVVYEPHKSTPEDVATEAFQTAAMAVRFLASLDRYEYTRCPQHDQAAAPTQEKAQ